MIGSNRPAHKSSTAFLMALVLSSTALTSVALTTGASANDLPSGANVTAGSVDIQSQADGLLINQATQNAIINWHDFSVGRDRSVHFNNGSGATLNRVTGPHISRIDGSLSATGSLYLVNQHGIVFGKDGVVKTGGSFVASTLDISDEDFLDGGNLTFKGDANTKIINQGKVGSLGGDVAFISRHIVNEGSISAPNGSVGLAVGREVLLQDAELDDGKFLVKVGDADSSITEAGVIDAASVELRAHGGNIYALAGNKGGAINASGTSRSGGRIFLTAGGGKVSVKKTLRAKSRRVRTASKPRSSIYINADVVNLAGLLDVSNEDGMGGKIDVGGNVISLTGARLNADGSQGGGDIRVGGAYQGGDFGNLTTATMLSVDDQTLLTASATDAGDGGDIVLWSDELTSFAGRIEAKGMQDGKGGDAEVSGKAKLAYLGFADLTSESGVFGTLLLDPYNVTLSNEPAFNSAGLAATGDDSNINITTLQTQLASANVTITTNGAGTQSGDILVADDITWDADTTLTLNADRNIAFFANVTKRGMGGLVLNHGAGGDYIIADGASIDLTGAGQYLTINGQNYTLISNMAQLDNIDNTGLSGHYALATDLDASGTTYTDALVGVDTANRFTGVFTGLGNTISNLTIDAPTKDYVGLFGVATNSTLRNIGLDEASVSGNNRVGALVGWNASSRLSFARTSGSVTGVSVVGGLVGQHNWFKVINDVYSTANVEGETRVGGLVGYASGTIKNAYAMGNVAATGGEVGGLVGATRGAISNSFAAGNVTGNNAVGGLVGQIEGGSIQNTYATGSVDGLYTVGGLVGYSHQSNIQLSHASGHVDGDIQSGGLVGTMFQGSTSSSYYDSETTGQSLGVGYNNGGTATVTNLTTTQARDDASYTAFDFTNDWYQTADMRPILRSEAGPTINGVTAVSNLNQLALMGSNLSGNYVLTKDIDASATDGSNTSGIWSPSGWVPIGNNSSGNIATRFSGHLDGNGHAITDLTINRPSEARVGLFGFVENGKIENVELANTNVTGNWIVGGLAGETFNADILDVITGGSVTGTGSQIGGLVGWFNNHSSGKMSGVSSSATVQGTHSVGGLVGYAPNANIEMSKASGTVTGTSGSVGGLIGNGNNATITASSASGNVTGSGNVGGLIGHISSSTISNVFATGNASGGNDVGGLIGDSSGGTLSNAFATGDVNATSFEIGGLIGDHRGTTVTNAYATGNVIGNSEVGGLFGYSYGTISNVYAVGQVAGSSQIGTLIGNRSNGTITGAFFDQSINPGMNAAGNGTITATSLTTAQFQDTDSFMTMAGAAGWDFNNVWSPPSAGYYPELYAVNPVVWVDSLTSNSVYGDATGTVTAANGHGGVNSFVFGPTPDSLGLIGTSISVDPTANAGTNISTLSSQNIMQTSDGGQAYRIFYHNSAAGSSTHVVAPRSITVTALGGSSSYGDNPTNPGLSASGLQNGQSVSVLTGLSNSFGITGTTNAGSHTLSVIGTLSNGNYVVTNRESGTWIVSPRRIDVTALGGTSTYGDSPANPGISATDLQNGQTASVLTGLSNSFGINGTTNAGNHTTSVVGTLTNGNYVIANRIDGNWVVSPRSIDVTALGGSSTYGDNPANPGISATGLQNGQTVSVLTGLSNSFGIDGTTNAGNHTTSVVGTLTNGNYAVANRIDGNWVVSPRSIDVTALGGSSTYGDNPANPGISATGLQNGQTVSVLTGLSNSFGIDGTTNAGNHTTSVVGTLTNGNYAVANRIDGNWVVSPRSIDVTALGGSSIYGDNPANPGISATGLQNGQTVSVLTGLSNSFGIDGTTNAGNHTTSVVGTLTNGNYAVANRIDGNWVVSPRSIDVTALGGSSIYGDNPANPGISATGLQNGQTVSVLTGLSNSFGISGTTNAGTYTTQVAGTLSNNNYTITQRVDGTWTVNRRPIYIFPHDQSRQYGAANPTLTYDVGWRGLVNGDVLNGSLDTPANVSSPVGQYAITAGTLTNANNPNYDISVESYGSNEQPVFLHVTPAPLTITASDATKYLGQYFQPTSYTVAGLLNMDSVDALTLFSSGSPTSAAIGNYDIVPSQASGQGLSNYSITYVNGRLTVQDAPGEVDTPRITMTSILPITACQDRFDKDGVVLNEDGTFARLQRIDCETDMAFDEVPKFN